MQALLWPDWLQEQFGLEGDADALWQMVRAQQLPPNPWWDPARYRALHPDVAASGDDPLEHYLRFGWREQRSTGSGLGGLAAFTADERDWLAVLVWPDWYLAQLPAALRAGLEPSEAAEHYLRLGVMAGWDPNPLFRTRYYGRANPDLLAAGCCLLLHYVRFGEQEGRRCHPRLLLRRAELRQWLQGVAPPGWPVLAPDTCGWKRQQQLQHWAEQEV